MAQGLASMPRNRRIVHVKTRLSMATAALLCCASLAPLTAGAHSWEVRNEVREGKREVNRERHEARHEINAARGPGYYLPPGQAKRYYYYNNNDRYYGDSRYYDRARYDDRYAWDRVAHFHPDGHYCRDVNHVAHYRDGYYRNDGRWYRDGRYWNEVAYVDRYYRRYRNHDDGNDDLLRGMAIGAAVVGVIAAVHEASDGD